MSVYWVLAYSSFEFIARNGIVGSSFWRTYHTVFHNDSIILHPCQQCTRVTIFLILANPCSFHFFDNCLPKGCEVLSHGTFSLHGPSGPCSWTCCRVFIGHLCIFGGEMFLQVLCTFFELGCLFYSSLYILISLIIRKACSPILRGHLWTWSCPLHLDQVKCLTSKGKLKNFRLFLLAKMEV